MTDLVLIIVIAAAVLAIAYALYSFFRIRKMKEGTDRMVEIASAIRIGAKAFIDYELKLIIAVAIAVAAVIAILVSWQAAVAFIIGAAP